MTDARPTPEEWFEIEQTLLTYTRGIDSKDYKLFRSGLTEDVYAAYAPPIGPFEGLDPLATWMEVSHAKLDASTHRVTNVALVEFGGDTATVESYVEVLLLRVGHPGGDYFEPIGIYTDRLRRDASGWKVTRKEFRFLHGTGNLTVLELEAASEAVRRLSES